MMIRTMPAINSGIHGVNMDKIPRISAFPHPKSSSYIASVTVPTLVKAHNSQNWFETAEYGA